MYHRIEMTSPSSHEMFNSVFLSVQIGDYVVVKNYSFEMEKYEWWVAKVIYIVGGARISSANSILQVINIDTGYIRFINADLISNILNKF